jgi:hypothetical protein
MALGDTSLPVPAVVGMQISFMRRPFQQAVAYNVIQRLGIIQLRRY